MIRLVILSAVLIMEAAIIAVTVYDFWGEMSPSVRFVWGGSMVSTFLLCVIVLYDGWYFERRMRQ